MKKNSVIQLTALLSITLIVLVAHLGCGSGMSSDITGTGGLPGGGMGVTPGGAQDFDYVRTLIEAGNVPQASNIITEGLLSEYDLPLNGEDPDQLLTLRAAVGFAGDTTVAGNGIWVQMGMATNIAPEDFHRPTLNLSVVLDKSGSMGYDKMQTAKLAVRYIVNQLTPDDLFSLTVFNQSSSVLIEPTLVTEPASLVARINTVSSGGSTNMGAGMTTGYAQITNTMNDYPEHMNRVILITDAMANTGDYSEENFQNIVANGTESQIGFTAVGVGIDFNYELIEFFATQHGANYYYMNSDQDAYDLFEEEFDYMVSPVAYDMQLTVTPHLDLGGFEVYGFPGEDPQELTMTVPTLFFSSRRGAILFKFDPLANDGIYLPTDSQVITIDLSYTTTDMEQHTDQLVASYGGASVDDLSEDSFDQEGLRLAVALARQTAMMRDICTAYWGEQDSSDRDIERAQTLADRLLTFLQEENDALDGGILNREISLAERLEELMY